MKHAAKIKDVVQGRVLFNVHAFPGRDNPGYITELHIKRKPYNHPSIQSPFSVAEHRYPGGSYTTSFSLSDAGIVQNRYNFHRTFTKRKAAEKYLAYITGQNLSGIDSVRVARYIDREIENELFDTHTFYDYDGVPA